MTKLTDAITGTAKSILPTDAIPADVFNAVNVAISYHLAGGLIDDERFSAIVKACGSNVENYDENDSANFTPEQTDEAVRALTRARRTRTSFCVRA